MNQRHARHGRLRPVLLDERDLRVACSHGLNTGTGQPDSLVNMFDIFPANFIPTVTAFLVACDSPPVGSSGLCCRPRQPRLPFVLAAPLGAGTDAQRFAVLGDSSARHLDAVVLQDSGQVLVTEGL